MKKAHIYYITAEPEGTLNISRDIEVKVLATNYQNAIKKVEELIPKNYKSFRVTEIISQEIYKMEN